MVCAASMHVMTNPSPALLRARGVCAPPEIPVLQTPLDLDIHPGLVAVTGDEGAGKTLLLHYLCGLAQPGAGSIDPAHACCLALAMPQDDAHTPREVWQRLSGQFAHWQTDLLDELVTELDLTPHLDKALFQLSSGSRRKVGIAGSLASGAALVCLDQPWMALDMASIQVLRTFLHDMADHPRRAWVVADYTADPTLPWRQVIAL